jgi:hypothetical protein
MSDYVFISSEDITTGAASAQSSASPVGATHVRLVATAACRVLLGVNPVAVATSTLVAASIIPEYIKIPENYKVAAIQEAAPGKLNVTFVRASRT